MSVSCWLMGDCLVFVKFYVKCVGMGYFGVEFCFWFLLWLTLIIIIGEKLGKESLKQNCYYVCPRNCFWRMLYVTGLTPRQLKTVNTNYYLNMVSG